MRVQGNDFDARVSQNEIREVGVPRGLAIVDRDSVADQFYTTDHEREPI